MAGVAQGAPTGRKPRKTRGRGLRTTTGCLVCKRRHIKCDEIRPQCGPCAKGQRTCVYGAGEGRHVDENQESSWPYSPKPIKLADYPPTPQPQTHDPLRALMDACHQEHSLQDRRNSYREWFAQHLAAQGTCPPGRKSTAPSHGPIGTPTSPREYHLSPTTDSSATPASVAPLSWFELLASDAANVDRGFVLSPPQSAPSAVAPSPPVNPLLQSPDLKTYTRREHESIQAASFHNDLETEPNLVPAIENPSSVLPDEPFTWNTAAPIQLSAQERRLFHHFVRNLSPVIDFFDIMKHFTTLVPHLALHNIGLMKSLLALSARHLSLHKDYANVAPLDDTGAISFLPIDRNVAVQYYYETLQYLNNVMQYPTYACSQELIATATLISTYEMLDGSNRDWERHIKGVFWIQRYQNNDGESGGLRQAVWWAWLRQDLWVGMRERRRVFSFWRPRRHISLLTAPELAHRAVYLLSQCVNYASREESETTDRQHRLERGNELLGMLQEWHDHLPQEYNPLPPIQNSDIFPPIWVCPPPYAAALQKHSLARVLVVLNRPSMGDPQDFRAGQNLLAESVNTICGISRTVNTDDIGAILTALPCLYGAGMCVQTTGERAALLDLLDRFQERLHWPANSLREELEARYHGGENTDVR